MAALCTTLHLRKEIVRSAKSALKNFPALLERTLLPTEYAGSMEESSEFRVMQWNVLADALADSSFTKCPAQALTWSNRQHRVIQEILTYNPDIICLEEVDHFKDFFQPTLEGVGYGGVFIPKQDSPCLKFPDNSGPDGCALFFDKERFILKGQKDKILEATDGCLTNQVALLVKLYDQLQGRSLYCCVTHLKAKPEHRELRLAQGKSILSTLKEFMNDDSSEVIVCGDFNAEPSESIYQLMEDGIYGVPLRSAYKSASRTEPEFTTWKIRSTGEVKHTIDYVWHSGGLKVSGYLKVPDCEEVNDNRLPCMEYPSDHMSLMFDVCWS